MFCQNLILGFSHLRIEFLLGPCALLALVLNHEFSVMEILWTFSIYLESVAILPQLFMVQKTGEAESITSHYLFALGSYRGLYILNWIYRYYSEGKLLNDLHFLAKIPWNQLYPTVRLRKFTATQFFFVKLIYSKVLIVKRWFDGKFAKKLWQ